MIRAERGLTDLNGIAGIDFARTETRPGVLDAAEVVPDCRHVNMAATAGGLKYR